VIDFKDIKGHEHAKRAIEVAMAGGHSILIEGFPGCGKTLLAQAAEGLLAEGVKAYWWDDYTIPTKTTGLLVFEFGQTDRPPSRLAETLKEAKAPVIITKPFCPCGNYTSFCRACVCTVEQITEFNRLWYEVFGLVHIFVELGRPEWEQLIDAREAETTERIKARVDKARKPFDYGLLDLQSVGLYDATSKLLRVAYRQMNFSPKQLHTVVKIAQTVSRLDFAKPGRIQAAHIAEAVQYRRKRD
jgi:predicted ATPase with chaperone activity